MALELFDTANNTALSAFTNQVKLHRFRPTEEATVMVSGSESSSLTLADTTPPIDEVSRQRQRDEWSRNTMHLIRHVARVWVGDPLASKRGR
jgi:hypothetical protein